MNMEEYSFGNDSSDSQTPDISPDSPENYPYSSISSFKNDGIERVKEEKKRKLSLSKHNSLSQIYELKGGGDSSSGKKGTVRKMISPDRMIRNLQMELDLLRGELTQERNLNSKLTNENENLKKDLQVTSSKLNHIEIVQKHVQSQNKKLSNKYREAKRHLRRISKVKEQVVGDYRAVMERANILEEENSNLKKKVQQAYSPPSPCHDILSNELMGRRHSDGFLLRDMNRKFLEKKMMDVLEEVDDDFSSSEEEEEENRIPSPQERANLFIRTPESPKAGNDGNKFEKERRKSEVRSTLIQFHSDVKEVKIMLLRVVQLWGTLSGNYKMFFLKQSKEIVRRISGTTFEETNGEENCKDGGAYGKALKRAIVDLGLEHLYSGGPRSYPMKLGEVEIKQGLWGWKPAVMEASLRFCCVSIFEKASARVVDRRRKSLSITLNRPLPQVMLHRRSLAPNVSERELQKGKLIKRFFLSNVKIQTIQRRCLKITSDDGVLIVRMQNIIMIHEWTSFICNILNLVSPSSTKIKKNPVGN